MGGPTDADARPRPVGKQIACLRVPRAEAAAASLKGRWSVASGQPGKAAVRTPRHSPESSDVLRRPLRWARVGQSSLPPTRAHLPQAARLSLPGTGRALRPCLLARGHFLHSFPWPPGSPCAAVSQLTP